MEKVDLDLLKDVEYVAKEVDRTIQKHGSPVFHKYPLTFTLLSLFGFSAVLYGFERVFDEISFFYEHPFVLLLAGLAILMATGTLYKWLQNKEINIH
jgi:hypothetical protein